MKRIFITGIAGFVGFHLAQALKRRGDFVIGCDHFNAYYDPALKKERARLLSEQGITTLKFDIVEKDRLSTEFQEQGITHVVHLAAQAGVRYSLKHPESYVHSNLSGFVQLLEVLKQFPNIRITFASSSSVYGLNTKIPFSESDSVDQPASFYGATKRANELIAHSYHHLYGIHCSALRFFTVYGPWGRPDMAYYSFTEAILNKIPISVFGQGKFKRDFTFINDIIEGTMAAIDLESAYEIFNLGNNTPVSVLELISTLETLLGQKAKIEFQPSPPGDVPITYADISKSQRVLGFNPKTPLIDGLKQFTDWYIQKAY